MKLLFLALVSCAALHLCRAGHGGNGGNSGSSNGTGESGGGGLGGHGGPGGISVNAVIGGSSGHQNIVRDILLRRLKFVQLGDSLYFFSASYEKLAWQLSGKFCWSLGMQLAEVETEEEQRLITQHIRSFVDDATYWLGGNDIETEGLWRWSSTGKLATFRSFAPGQPNDKSSEDCLTITIASDTKSVRNWADRDCTKNNQFICELHYKPSAKENE